MWTAILLSLIPFVDGNCGFPGLPLKGGVEIRIRSDQQESGTHWTKYQLDGRVDYFCDAPFRLVGRGSRHCVNGRWNGTLPYCSENMAINASISYLQDENGTSRWIDWNKESCRLIPQSGQIKFRWERPSRLYALEMNGNIEDQQTGLIRIELTSPTNNRVQLNCTLIDRLCHLIDGDWTELVVMLDGSHLCDVSILTFQQHQCGSPEIPVNGGITWIPGNRIATYSCDDGFHLDGDPVRECIGGSWTSNQPLCQLVEMGYDEEPELSVKEKLNILLAVCLATTTFVIILLAILHKRNRLRCPPAFRKDVDDFFSVQMENPIGQNSRCESSQLERLGTDRNRLEPKDVSASAADLRP